jgi:nitrilase
MGTEWTVAAVQASYVLMDREATTSKVEQLIADAADLGARLIVFPEVFIPGTRRRGESNQCPPDERG